jgi:hypothetical protein
MLWTTVAEGANSPTGSANYLAVPVSDVDSFAEGLREAEEVVGFEALVPKYVPTKANKPSLVDASIPPAGQQNGLRLIHLVYESEAPADIGGRSSYHRLEIFQLPIRLNDANGEPYAANLAGYEVHKDVVSVDEYGAEIKATYTARNETSTLVMDFTGDQPTLEGLNEMLGSLDTLD